MNPLIICPYCEPVETNCGSLILQRGQHLRCDRCDGPLMCGPITLPIFGLHDEAGHHIATLRQPVPCRRCYHLVTHVAIACPALWRGHAHSVL